ncbi:10388_t:CDS:2 [Ambispora gerdemannii]|uniref:10388_t:CDS:1 n=1 Tax=Ambispora gerdemannii TaxID=144530 RepID=A0A9N8WIL3_9GLOM|nr:10388_t:CDS:2 [Ambispora gerdemannii]
MRNEKMFTFQTTDSTFANKKANTINVELVPKNRIPISQLQIGQVHVDKFLLCRVITKCAKSTALAMVIEDPANKISPKGLSVEQASRFLPIGTILAIQNPYYKTGSQDAQTMLRSDNPNEVVIIKPDDKLLAQVRWKTSIGLSKTIETETLKVSSADDFRVRGNEYFGKKGFTSAVDEYSRGIELDSRNVVLYINRSEAHLRLSQFKRAFDDAETALKIDHKYQKAAIRKEIEEYQNQAQELHSENKHGNYNYIKIINEFLKKIETRKSSIDAKEWIHPGGPRLDYADYINDAIEIKQVGEKGRAWAEPKLAQEIYDLYAGPETIASKNLDENSLKSPEILWGIFVQETTDRDFGPGDLMFVRAQRPIKKGEELTLAYTNPRAESNKIKQLRVKIHECYDSDVTSDISQFAGV